MSEENWSNYVSRKELMLLEEAAADLEIPLGTLKSRLRLAMGKLRQLIGTSE